MKKLFIAFSLLLIGAVSYGQAEVAIGLKGGANFANISSSSDVNTDGITSYHAGAYARIKLLSFGIQPEVLISSQGTQVDGEDLTLDYVNVPVMVMFNLPLGINLHAGPQFGFLTNAEGDDGTDIKDFYKNSDVSLGIGAGINLKKINFTARYLVGLSDITDVSGADELKNNVFQLSVGFDLFSLGN